MKEYARVRGEGAETDVIVPASFNFPHTGKLLSLSFVLFAGWFADTRVPVTAYPRLAATGLLVMFGNVNAAVPFLLDMGSFAVSRARPHHRWVTCSTMSFGPY